MAILMPCKCGEVYNLKGEFSGALLLCPKCGAEERAPHIDRTSASERLNVFTNSKFLIRQNHFSISTKYLIRDDAGRDILFVERPSNYLARMFLFILLIVVFISLHSAFALILLPLYFLINIRRTVTFYNNAAKEKILLKALQNNWFQKKWIRYTLLDHTGAALGYFEKNRFSDFLRRKWCFRTPNGELILTAREDSLIASLLRRVTGYFFDFAIFRTNFLFYAGDSEQVVGEFNKKIALFDRYVLDMTIDSDNLIDRRVALALGVLLDTGEGR